MALAFVETISILGILAIQLISGGILMGVVFRILRRRRGSSLEWGIAFAALVPILILGCILARKGNREYNPTDCSLDRVSGTYTNGDDAILLREDRTYSSVGVDGLSSGEWHNADWNLHFENSSLQQPRWIIRNGVPAILPYYSGVDGADGLLFTKEQ